MEYADIRYVRGNDVTLVVTVKTPVLDSEGQPVTGASGGITYETCELDTFDEWGLRIVRQGIKSNHYPAGAEAGVDRGTIVVTIPYTLPCGTYALEFTAIRNDQHVRSYELVMFGIVEDNKDANVVFGEIGGHRSLDLDLTVQYISQTTTRGKNAYELWREMEGNEDKTLQDYFDYLGFQEDYNAKADKVKNANNGNFAALDANGNIKDSGKNESSFLNQEDLLAFPVDNNGYDYVDLGLPSGTLWATKNVGAVDVWDYGNYYRFGTGSRKYIYGSPSDDSDYYQGQYSVLPLEYDTAYVVLGGGWEMPTREQIRELINETGIEWVENYRNSGVSGITFSNNGQELFIPAGGWIQSGEQAGVGSYCDIWTKEKSTSSDANLLTASFFGNADINVVHCLTGMNVRGVIKRNEYKNKVPKYITSHQDISAKQDVVKIINNVSINPMLPIVAAKPSCYYNLGAVTQPSIGAFGLLINLYAPRQDAMLSKYMFRVLVNSGNLNVTLASLEGLQILYPTNWSSTLEEGYEYIITVIYDGIDYILSYEKYSVPQVSDEGL